MLNTREYTVAVRDDSIESLSGCWRSAAAGTPCAILDLLKIASHGEQKGKHLSKSITDAKQQQQKWKIPD